jgi:hypothetical protein
VLNRVYVYLVSNMDKEQREQFENELYAPPEGLEAAEANLMAALYQAAGEGL